MLEWAEGVRMEWGGVLEWLAKIAAAAGAFVIALRIGRSIGRIEQKVEHAASSVEENSAIVARGFERNDETHDELGRNIGSLATGLGERVARLEGRSDPEGGG